MSQFQIFILKWKTYLPLYSLSLLLFIHYFSYFIHYFLYFITISPTYFIQFYIKICGGDWGRLTGTVEGVYIQISLWKVIDINVNNASNKSQSDYMRITWMWAKFTSNSIHYMIMFWPYGIVAHTDGYMVRSHLIYRVIHIQTQFFNDSPHIISVQKYEINRCYFNVYKPAFCLYQFCNIGEKL